MKRIEAIIQPASGGSLFPKFVAMAARKATPKSIAALNIRWLCFPR